MKELFWYEIRPGPESSLCVPMQKGNTCIKGPRCLKPHNSLEKEIWESERKAKAMEQRELENCFNAEFATLALLPNTSTTNTWEQMAIGRSRGTSFASHLRFKFIIQIYSQDT